jgi:hypothetical protein
MGKLVNDNIEVKVYKHTAMEWTGFKGIRIATNFGGLLSYARNEPAQSTDSGSFLDQSKDYYYLHKEERCQTVKPHSKNINARISAVTVHEDKFVAPTKLVIPTAQN